MASPKHLGFTISIAEAFVVFHANAGKEGVASLASLLQVIFISAHILYNSFTDSDTDHSNTPTQSTLPFLSPSLPPGHITYHHR